MLPSLNKSNLLSELIKDHPFLRQSIYSSAYNTLQFANIYSLLLSWNSVVKKREGGSVCVEE